VRERERAPARERDVFVYCNVMGTVTGISEKERQTENTLHAQDKVKGGGLRHHSCSGGPQPKTTGLALRGVDWATCLGPCTLAVQTPRPVLETETETDTGIYRHTAIQLEIDTRTGTNLGTNLTAPNLTEEMACANVLCIASLNTKNLLHYLGLCASPPSPRVSVHQCVWGQIPAKSATDTG
jgi:hypothetical protein